MVVSSAAIAGNVETIHITVPIIHPIRRTFGIAGPPDSPHCTPLAG
jgi:hypothetical protein